MKHVAEGVCQAYVDEALRPDVREAVDRHVARCRRCAKRLDAAVARQGFVDVRLVALRSQLAHRAESTRVAPRSVRQRLAHYEISKQEEGEMSKERVWLPRRVSPALVGGVLVVVLALSLAFPPVRALAGEFLGLFRVQQIEVVEFSPSALFGEVGPEAAMQSLERVMDQQVEVEVAGEPQQLDEMALRSLSSIRVRLPLGLPGAAHYRMQPAAEVSVQVDLPRIRALLAELGYSEVVLPDALDGAQIDVVLPPSIIAAYGACEPNTEAWASADGPGAFSDDCTVLVQMLSPTVSPPPGLDVDQLGQAYLQLLGMSAEEAASFSRQIDWTATLVMPLPRGEVTYRELSVDGAQGVLIRPTNHRLPTSEYLLMWTKEGVIYTLTGVGTDADAQQVANTLQ